MKTPGITPRGDDAYICTSQKDVEFNPLGGLTSQRGKLTTCSNRHCCVVGGWQYKLFSELHRKESYARHGRNMALPVLPVAYAARRRSAQRGYNPFRTAVLFRGQTASKLSGLSPKRDCSPKMVTKSCSQRRAPHCSSK